MTWRKPPMPRLTRYHPGGFWRDTRMLMVLNTAGLIQTVVELASFGLITWDLRAWVLFELCD